MKDGLANWQWLADLSNREKALLVMRDADSKDWYLTEGFESVQRLLGTEQWLDAIPSQSLDCVVIPDCSVLSSENRSLWASLAAAHRVLRSKTGFYVGVESMHKNRVVRTINSLLSGQMHAHTACLAQVGFRDIREYFISPSIETPRHLIPANPSALRAWERAIAERGWQSTLRSALFSIGAATTVLRHRLIIART